MTEPLLEVRRLVKHFGAVVATAALDLVICLANSMPSSVPTALARRPSLAS